MKSCKCRTAHVGKRKAVVGAGMNGEQVASEWASKLFVEVTILAVLFCCYFARYYMYIADLSCLDFWVLGWVYFQIGWATLEWVGLFSRERVVENMHTPLFEQPLKLITHGHIFERLRYVCVSVTITLFLYMCFVWWSSKLETTRKSSRTPHVQCCGQHRVSYSSRILAGRGWGLPVASSGSCCS